MTWCPGPIPLHPICQPWPEDDAYALSRLFADEFKAWIPWLLDRLARRAIAKLPDEFKDRYDEEWRGHLNETPGELGELVVAFGFSIAADRMNYGPWTVGRVLETAIDKSLGGLLFVSVIPIMLLIIFSIKLDSKGPVLVKREYGFANRMFSLFKFRTMQAGGARDPDGPRITRVGRFLRRHSLDELPQLINVLRGDMSLVGPLPDDREDQPNPDRAVQRHLKPGITGLAQVKNTDGPLSASDRARYDREYTENWSIWLDLKILLRTIHAVLKDPKSGC